MNQRPLSFYEFGPFRLNVTERLLQCGDDLVPLSPKVFDTLLILVENHGHVVGKRELMEALWPDTFVEESSLTQNISLLRRALNGTESDRQYIETIPKRGYRFIGDVQQKNEWAGRSADTTIDLSTVQATETGHRLGRRLNVYVAALAACVLIAAVITFGYRLKQRSAETESLAGKSIAVLPFKTIGGNSEGQLLGLGMADALIIKLSRLQDVTVLPTGSVFQYTDGSRDARTIGYELGVHAVLDGTIQRQGDLVRVTAQLIRVSDGKTISSVKYDERQNNIFALQDSISEQLASSLIPEMSVSRTGSLLPRSTENTDAYQAYLLGLQFWNRRTKENLAKAVDYLQQAVQLDPNFGQAHAILADCYFLSGTDEYRSIEPDEAINRAEASANRALEIDDTIAEAHTVKAGIHLMRRQHDDATREFRRALELKPTYAIAHLSYGYLLLWDLRLVEGLSHMRRAQQLDPAAPITNAALGSMLLSARQNDESIKYTQRALELEPNMKGARINLGDAYLAKGMFAEAIREFEKLPPDDDEYVVAEKAYAYAVARRTEQARHAFATLQKLVGTHGAPYAYARIYGALGEKDKAFDWLEKMNLNRMMQSSLKYDAQLDSLRDDPRFRDFLRRHALEHLVDGSDTARH